MAMVQSARESIEARLSMGAEYVKRLTAQLQERRSTGGYRIADLILADMLNKYKGSSEEEDDEAEEGGEAEGDQGEEQDIGKTASESTRGSGGPPTGSNRPSKGAVSIDDDRRTSSQPVGSRSAGRSGSRCGSRCSSGSHPRSDTSENNSCPADAIPCCRKRKKKCPKDCPPGQERVYMDPCCCNPCVPTPFVENIKLKQENKELRRCIKKVKECAATEACEMIKDVLGGCTCSCCLARKSLFPSKSSTNTLGRETWLCVPLPGSGHCGGYTPSGWSRLLKKCREMTCDTGDPCAPCEITCEASPCLHKRCMCLPLQRPCPPCPHLCPVRCLPKSVRPYIPCCPLYFPNDACSPASYPPSAACSGHTTTGASYKSYGSMSGSCCKTTGITEPPYKPKYMNLGNGCPQMSTSVPLTLNKETFTFTPGSVGTQSPYKIETPTRGFQSR